LHGDVIPNLTAIELLLLLLLLLTLMLTLFDTDVLIDPTADLRSPSVSFSRHQLSTIESISLGASRSNGYTLRNTHRPLT